MWDELNRLQQALITAIDEHTRLCNAPEPDRNALSAGRWRVAQAGRVRMEYLNGTAFPAAEAAAFGEETRRVAALRDATPAYQRHISGYVARWPTEAIVADWTGYRAAAMVFCDEVKDRVTEEASILRPVLRRSEVAGRGD